MPERLASSARVASARVFIELRLGSHRLRVLAEQVMRVASLERLWALPSDLDCNLGMTVLDGVVVGLVDLEKLLELPIAGRIHPWPTLPCLCVVARLAGGVAAFPVDEVRERRIASGRPKQSSEHALIDLSTLDVLPQDRPAARARVSQTRVSSTRAL